MDIVLATINAKYIHASVGLRYLRANLGDLRERSMIMEFTGNERPVDIVERLLAETPRVIGLGVYIWNAEASLSVVRMLRAVAPHVHIVLGGPEVSHETEQQEICRLAQFVITGEGENAFAELARHLLAGRPPLTRMISGGLPELSSLVLPYDEYSDDDVANRVVYVEASRGCPFQCEFCLSSLDQKVRNFPLPTLLAALERLVERGCRQFKFVDRTFNLTPKTTGPLLDFFLARQDQGVFVHFEMVPDRFPEELKSKIAQFRPGAIQLEVGIQTLAPETEALISRRQQHEAVFANLRWLAEHTGAHVHADLIVGLPGEDLASFGRGFDTLVALGAQEIQVGILKRLRGTPIIRHDAEFQVAWSAEPPYEILANRLISFIDMQRAKRFARVWDLVANRGHFARTVPLLWQDDSPFARMMVFADWLSARASLGGVALARLTELLLLYLTTEAGLDREMVLRTMAHDMALPGARVPTVLQPYVAAVQRERRSDVPARQARHL